MKTTIVVSRKAQRRSRLVLATTAVAVFLLALYLVEHFIAERFWLFTLLTYAPQQWTLILPVPLFIVTVCRRCWKIAVANLFLLGFIGFALMGFCWRGIGNRHASRSDNTVRLMTFNIEHGNGGIGNIAEAVAGVNPDIVCFNEVNAEKPGGHSPYATLRQALPAYTFTIENKTVIASRLPMTQSRILPPAGKGLQRRSVLIEVNANGGPLCVLATHLATLVTPETLDSHKGNLSSYLRRTAVARREQVDALLAEVITQKDPIIVCGDFNTPPRGLVYGRLTGAMTDAFAAQGIGYGHTFSTTHPLLRIDYIFTANGAAARNCHVVPANASDHRPLTADIVLPLAR